MPRANLQIGSRVSIIHLCILLSLFCLFQNFRIYLGFRMGDRIVFDLLGRALNIFSKMPQCCVLILFLSKYVRIFFFCYSHCHSHYYRQSPNIGPSALWGHTHQGCGELQQVLRHLEECVQRGGGPRSSAPATLEAPLHARRDLVLVERDVR